MKTVGRKTPYTARGITRLLCACCRTNRSSQQWSACANGNRHIPVCVDCDIHLNRLLLSQVAGLDVDALMERYETTLRSQHEA